ncbi:uncharacterized protein LOC129597631 [Paramacrobiotus metropolitanus]|uniref:uncharacterized protein LOC129597631 n=1 Tax=Paramacrobiotus metropolitanus TaxID=2943436 RepID=UPI00244620E0|nr:uncharacterized protein LOC129597631 [Paramacrobiotus metropolitanus]
MLRPEILTLGLIVISAVLVTNAYGYRCPGPEWTPRRNSTFCYLFVHRSENGRERRTFSEAQSDCMVQGGQLVDVQNAPEREFLELNMRSRDFYDHRYWIGLSFETGVWKWTGVDRVFSLGDLGDFNPALDFSFQTSMESSKLKARVYMEADSSQAKWVPKVAMTFPDAQSDMNYICKAKYSSRPLCKTEDGWAYFNGRCLKMYTTSDTSAMLTTWNEAARICLAEGSHIAVPSDPSETDYLTNLLVKFNVKEMWIGLTVTKPQTGFNAQLVAWEDDTSVIRPGDTDPWIAIGSSNITVILNNLPAGRQHCATQDIKTEEFIAGSYQIVPKWRIGTEVDECDRAQKAFACETDMEICPYGWNHYGNHCYQIHGSDSDKKTWNDASTECQNQGGHLVVVQNPSVQQFLEARISALGLEWETAPGVWSKQFWIGLSSFGSGSYSWLTTPDDLSSGGYFNWGFAQPLPAVQGKQFCARMGAVASGATSVIPLPWETTHCGSPSNFICQAGPQDAVQADAVHEPLKCDPPFVLYHDRCYWFSSDLVTWDAARAACYQINSLLVQIDSMAENNYIKDQLSTDTWIGFRVIRPNMNSDLDSFLQYADGRNVSEADYKNLGQVTIDDNAYCFIMDISTYDYYRGKWFSRPCSDKKPFICTHRGEPAPPKPEPTFFYPECGENWVLIGSNCYKLNLETLNFGLALQVCHSEGPDSQLLYLTSPEEERDVVEMLNGRRNLTSSLMTTDASYWTALQIEKPDQWYWKGRSGQIWELPVAYTNFASNAKFDSASTRNPACVTLKASGGGWLPESCNNQLRFSVCKKPANITQTITSTTTALPFDFTYGCPKGWHHQGTSCFRRNVTAVSWTVASETCRKEQAHLAAIASQTQLQQMKEMLRDAWIGLNSRAQPVDPRIYRNDDGSPVLYTPWNDQIARPGKPNPTDVDCVAVTGTTIDSYSCGTQRPFVCMLPEVKTELLPPECITPPHDTGCRRWGYGYKESCLYMGNDASNPSGQREPLTFEDARAMCRKHFDADLVIINNADKQEFIAHLIGQWSSDYWIGLKEEEMPWDAFKKWVTGENVAYTNWAHSEPHVSQGNRGCVALVAARGDLHNPGEWYVNPCSSYKFALCEGRREGWTPPTPAPTAFVSGCPKDWRTPDTVSRSCYKLFDPSAAATASGPALRKLTWQEAEDFCIGYRGHLASIDSLNEQNVISFMLPYTSWQANQQRENFWIGLKEKDQSWAWSDGSVYGTNTFFNSMLDHSTTDVVDCVAMEAYTGSWIKQNCQLSWGWVCEVPKGFYTEGEELPTLPPTIETNQTCGPYSARGDWFYHAQSDTCFFVSRFQESWMSAQSFCNGIESNLASIDAGQHDFLAMVISKQTTTNTQFWIGLRLRDVATNQHAWVDGSNSHFRAWAADEPHPFGVEACVSMDNRIGKWRDEVCGVAFEFICRRSPNPISIATATPPPSSAWNTWGCPTQCPGCLSFRDSCYFFSSPLSQADWNNAHASCGYLYMNEEDHTKSSQLLSIHDALEQSFVVAQMGRDRVNRWMGLFEDRQKKGWFYSDDTPFDYTNWDFSEPVPYPQESLCVYILGEAGRAGTWNDHFCRDRYPYICKMKKDAKFSPPTAPPTTKCPTGFSGVGDACFKVIELSGLHDWDSAVATCRSQTTGSRIASITNVYENAQIHVLLAERLGFKNDSYAKAWIGLQERQRKLSWPTSGCLPTYNNIREFYSVPTVDMTTCGVFTYDGVWHTAPCTADLIYYAVCEVREPECPKAPEPVNGTCPDGASIDCGGQFCYRVEVPTPTKNVSYTWNEAKAACVALNGSLASIRSEEENICLQRWVEHSTGAWIGLVEKQVDSSWPGRYEWSWMDPAAQFGSFNNWGPGKPSGSGFAREPCAEMGSDGKWYNYGCDGRHQHPRGYICETEKTIEKNETCGESSHGDWFYHPQSDSCFLVSRFDVNWGNAETLCNSAQAHLATVEADQQDFLTTVLGKQAGNATQFWIGLRLRDVATNQHAWVDGSTSYFRAWAPGEPHPFGVEACVTMDSRTGKWKDEVCGVDFPYVCKKRRTPIVPTVTPTPPASYETWGCPCPNCVPFRESCYYFSAALTQAGWNTAHTNCKFIYPNDDFSKQSHLLSIHDILEESFVVAQMGKDRVDRWMGLFEDSQKQSFFYTDDTPLDYTNWDFNEPIPYPQEPLCVYILGEAGRAGRWNDHFCRTRLPYICKVKKDPQFPAVAPTQNCPAGFTDFPSGCLKVIELPAGRRTWDDGVALCGDGNSGSRIASVTNVYENAQIHVLLAEKVKFANTSSAEAWIGSKVTSRSLGWTVSECLPTYNNIPGFYSLPDTGVPSCVFMTYDGVWQTGHCSAAAKNYAVCEIRNPECSKHPEPVNGVCPEGFSVDCRGTFCYKVELPTESKNYTWSEARDACTAINGSLASIRSMEDNACLQQYVEHSTGAWIGLVEEQMDMWGSRYEWKWMDSDVPFGSVANWAEGKPGASWPRETCAEMRNDGKWVNMACEVNAQHPRGYICETRKIPTTGTSDPTTTVASTTSRSSAQTLPPGPTGSSTVTSMRSSTMTTGRTPPITLPGSTPSKDPIGGVETTPATPSQGISAGGLVGIGVAIALIVPLITVLGYLAWRRKTTGQPMFGGAKRLADSEHQSVIQHEEHESYT